MWFDSWSDLARVAAVGAAAYATLVVALRLSGKRTLAKLNAFDFVVTVALGSTLATILLSSTVAWADGATALLVLIGLQLVVATLTAWSERARRLLTSAPTLLLWHGTPHEHTLRRHRISMSEIRQAVRSTGAGDLSSVAAVVLETDGTISVVSESRAGDLTALHGVTGVPEQSR